MAESHAGKLTFIWQPDPPAPGHTAGYVRTATVAIDHPDPLGLLSDAISEALGIEFGGPGQRDDWSALEAIETQLELRRARPSTLDTPDVG